MEWTERMRLKMKEVEWISKTWRTNETKWAQKTSNWLWSICTSVRSAYFEDDAVGQEIDKYSVVVQDCQWSEIEFSQTRSNASASGTQIGLYSCISLNFFSKYLSQLSFGISSHYLWISHSIIFRCLSPLFSGISLHSARLPACEQD